ncbi:MAG: tetratricopeptide repeat protein [Pseudomonadales bacterium]
MRVARLPCVRLAAVFLAVGLTSACSTADLRPGTLPDRASLLSGESVFGEPVATDTLPELDILAASDEMQAFVAAVVGDTRMPNVKFRRLLKGLADHGYFNQSYVADITRTASDTFARKSGNCLSYTNLFIALARGAGLEARYQMVDVPPSWDADAGYIIRYTHINVVMRGFGFDPIYGRETSVDFNDVLPEPDYPRREISDREAAALFYANRSISLLRSGDSREAFVHLKKAIELDPDNANLWINLGAFYAKQEAYPQALGAYRIALHEDPGNRGAVSGLGRAHYLLGNLEEAERYEARARRYRDGNPYYHYAIAQVEYERAHYDQALEAINAAIGLKYRNGRFHFLKGLTEYKLGDLDEAQNSFRRAARYGNYRDLKQRYLGDLAQVEQPG